VPSKWDAKDAFADVPRPELHAALAQLLRPAATDTYAVIVGETGSGKSTAVRKAARASSADGASGVVFIEINEVRKFSKPCASSSKCC
jgi:type II secretory pathway predicted ATPase ExeA